MDEDVPADADADSAVDVYSSKVNAGAMDFHVSPRLELRSHTCVCALNVVNAYVESMA